LLTVRLAATPPASAVLALPVSGSALLASGPAPLASGSAPLASGSAESPPGAAELAAMLADVENPGQTGAVNVLPRPGRRPSRILAVGIGDGDESGWRGAGAAVARAAGQEPSVAVILPAEISADAVRGIAEGLWLASYRYRLAADARETAPKLRQVTLAVVEPDRYEAALATARATAEATILARDLTNTPSMRKNPAWFATQVSRAAGRHRHLTVTVRDRRALRAEGFGAILAVGGGSASGPRLVELGWRPPGARTHVVLVGKGITFDSGGLSIKSRDTMLLARKDMGGAAAIVAATLGAAALDLRVRVTALAPLAENMVGGDAYRPGDVIRHYGGITTEIQNTDAEGRLVLADALAYAARRLRPDVLVDLATLTGASRIALGSRTAALFSDDDELAAALTRAADRAGERVWRLPLPADYVEYLSSDVADYNHWPQFGAGAVVAALYLREFTGQARGKWAHLDMSAPSWSDRADGELGKGATGWGVRTLLRWLTELAGAA
jgi:leucyl aminopeptidase